MICLITDLLTVRFLLHRTLRYTSWIKLHIIFILSYKHLLRSRDNVVVVAIDYGLDDRGIGVESR